MKNVIAVAAIIALASACSESLTKEKACDTTMEWAKAEHAKSNDYRYWEYECADFSSNVDEGWAKTKITFRYTAEGWTGKHQGALVCGMTKTDQGWTGSCKPGGGW